MSIIRLSFLPSEPEKVYETEKGPGNLGKSMEIEQLGTFLAAQVTQQAGKLNDPKQPVVVMVHGFWYDPASKIEDKKPQGSNNPHDRNFHFNDRAFQKPTDPKSREQKHWLHTRSWPRGIGFEENDEGANGLAVAFGWDSTPAALKFRTPEGRFTVPEAWKDALGEVLTRLLDSEERAKLYDDLIKARDALMRLQESGTDSAKQLAEAVRDVVRDAERLKAAYNAKDVIGGTKATLALRASWKRVRDTVAAALEELGTEIIPIVDLVLKYAPGIYDEAYNRALRAGEALALTLTALARNDKLKHRKIDLLCHSLGSRVVLQALRTMAPADLIRIGRVVIIGGAEYSDQARIALSAVEQAPGTPPSFYNFMGRRDRVLTNIAAEYKSLQNGGEKRYPIGAYGLREKMRCEPHWIDLQLDAEEDGSHALEEWLTKNRQFAKGNWLWPHLIAAGRPELKSSHPLGVLNHWYYFTNPTNMELFRNIIRDPDRNEPARNHGLWSIDQMRKDGLCDYEAD